MCEFLNVLTNFWLLVSEEKLENFEDKVAFSPTVWAWFSYDSDIYIDNETL